MIAQLTSRDCSPQLCPQLRTVLSSLSVTLDAELYRYRRNRYRHNQAETNLFADIDDASFDLAVIENAVEASIKTAGAIARAIPPSLPPNKKLLSGSTSQAPESSSLVLATLRSNESKDSPLINSPDKNTHSPASSEETEIDTVSSGYLASSEKLIESLTQIPHLLEPIDTLAKPKKKTVSLLAGGALGFLGLIAGLGASYLMANPLIAQRIASQFQPNEAALTATQSNAFDPPGPDLSANEFVDLELNNLSSLTMPQTISPSELTLAANVPDNLAQTNSPSSPPPALPSTQEPSTLPSIPPATSPIALAPPVGTPPVVVPARLTYYVTSPFSSEQGLLTIRETISEAFVRKFSDGNRIQIAAFDNPQAAQSFVTKLSAEGITAQIYGPTVE